MHDRTRDNAGIDNKLAIETADLSAIETGAPAIGRNKPRGANGLIMADASRLGEAIAPPEEIEARVEIA